jgi:hypothetical protein
MITHYANDSTTVEWLRDQIAMESEGDTVRLPVICPEAFEVCALTPEQAKAALVEEFGEAA